jgi:hypothetical protein
MLPIASAGTLLTSGNSGGLEFPHYLRRDIGRYDQGHESEPASEIRLEGFLVAITLIDGLAGDVRYDLVPPGGREKLDQMS